MTRANNRLKIYMLIGLTGLFGWGSLLFFFLFIYMGSLEIINLGLDGVQALLLNGGLCLAFFIQHSGMVRQSFRTWLSRFVSKDFHGAIYAMASGVALLALVVFWQDPGQKLWAPKGAVFWVLRGIFLLSVLGAAWGALSLKLIDPMGFKPVLSRLSGQKPPSAPFIVRGAYKWVRHPVYFFFMVMAWTCPEYTAPRLLFNVLFTVWIFIGAILEERDLLTVFGDEYKEYQRQAPMLIPYRIPKK